jgi:putative nucleotidyltransferase with HDIG domain
MAEGSSSLHYVIEQIEDLPSLPLVLAKVTALLSDPRTSAEDVGRAIASDQALASRVIRLVNSAFYGFPGRIQTISHAISLLGFSTVHNVVLTTSVMSAFAGSDNSDDSLDLQQFWLHSIAVGSFAKTAARLLHRGNPEEAFVAGLLHDVGKLVMLNHLPKEYRKVLTQRTVEKCSLRQAERRNLGTDHAEVGAWLARLWNMPEGLQRAIGGHHAPGEDELCMVVHLGDILARALELGNGGDVFVPPLSISCAKGLGLGRTQLDAILAGGNQETLKAKVFLQIV